MGTYFSIEGTLSTDVDGVFDELIYHLYFHDAVLKTISKEEYNHAQGTPLSYATYSGDFQTERSIDPSLQQIVTIYTCTELGPMQIGKQVKIYGTIGGKGVLCL